MLGGSTAYGYGVNWEDAIPAQLERALTSAPCHATVVNLGYNNEGAHSLRFTLEDYLWLDYDAAILYEGYNDVSLDTAPDANRQVFRRDSPVFRLTGYLPIFPIIFKEKAAALRCGRGGGRSLRREPEDRVSPRARGSGRGRHAQRCCRDVSAHRAAGEP